MIALLFLFVGVVFCACVPLFLEKNRVALAFYTAALGLYSFYKYTTFIQS